MPLFYRKQPVKAVITDVTMSRALDTIYQNTCGRPILATVSIICQRAVLDEKAYGRADVEDATPPTKLQAAGGFTTTGPTDNEYFCLTFAIPNGYYYKVSEIVDGGSNIILFAWVEVEL